MTFHCLRRFRLQTIWSNLISTSPWALVGFAKECQGNWHTPLLWHSHLCKIMAVRREARGLEESKCHPSIQKGRQGGTGQSASPGRECSGDHFNHVEDKKVISSQYAFTKGKSCLTSLITFHDGTTGWRLGGRAVGVAYLDFRKAFNKVSHEILVGEFRESELNEWIVRWIENWQSSEGCYQWYKLKTCNYWCSPRFSIEPSIV